VTQPLLIEHDDGVDRVTLNRRDSLNALDPGMIDALNAYFESLQRNRSTNAGSIEAVIAMEDRNQVVQPLGRLQRRHPGLSGKAKACVYQAITTRIRKGPEYEKKG
jgi:hypothetical protein